MKRITKSILKNFAALAVVIAAIFATTACGQTNASSNAEKGTESNPIKIGVVGASDEQWPVFKEEAKKEGISVEIVDFAEYTTPNPALHNGDIDLNEFQHILYLAKYNVDANDDLTPIAATATFPISLYGDAKKGATSLDAIKNGDQIAIPSDGTNQSRAIFLLNSAKLVELKDSSKVYVTPADIDEEKSVVKVVPVLAAETAANIVDPKIKAAVINNDFVKNLSDENQNNVLFTEKGDSEGAKPYINVWVAKADQANNEKFLKLAEIFLNNQSVRKALENSSGGADKVVHSDGITKDDLAQILKEQETIYSDSK